MLNLIEINESNKQKLINDLKERISEADEKISKSVGEILNKVKNEGDNALIELTEKFDKVRLEAFEVSEADLDKCFN